MRPFTIIQLILIKSTLIILAAFLLSACELRTRMSDRRKIACAEQLLQSNPDSALNLMNSIQTVPASSSIKLHPQQHGPAFPPGCRTRCQPFSTASIPPGYLIYQLEAMTPANQDIQLYSSIYLS